MVERDLGQVRAIGRAIRAWGTEGGADSRRPDLPWRSTRDPWAVLVSEVMAQQTQLARVVPAYRRFLAAFPTPAACAAAPLGDVLRAWDGLGYNRRAPQSAPRPRAMVDRPRRRGPRRPRRAAGAPRRRPLHGPGGARLRLRARRRGGRHQRRTGARPGGRRSAGPRRVKRRRWSTPWFPRAVVGSSAQALLDLGATVCTARTPRCDRPARSAADAGGRRRQPAPPDPAPGSAGVSTAQSAFDGSDRQGRGD